MNYLMKQLNSLKNGKKENKSQLPKAYQKL